MTTTFFRDVLDMQVWRFTEKTGVVFVNGAPRYISEHQDVELRFVGSVGDSGVFLWVNGSGYKPGDCDLFSMPLSYAEPVNIIRSKIYIAGCDEPVLIYEYDNAPSRWKKLLHSDDGYYIALVPFDIAKYGLKQELGFLLGNSWFGDTVVMFIERPYQIYIGVKA